MFDLMPFGRRNRDLFRDFEDLSKSFFGENAFDFKPFRTDISDHGDAYVLEAELPGFKKEEIHIDLNNSYLTISAQHSEEKEERDNKDNFIRRERSYGSFQRSFSLSNVKEDAIEASYNQGVLKLVMPKKEKSISAARRLEIKD